jgi:lipopolysaccharide assembly outer membrane protein LptD (OstA)
MRLTNFSTSLSFSLSELLKGGSGSDRPVNPQNTASQGLRDESGLEPANDLVPQTSGGVTARDEYGYPIFDVPWALNLSYSLSYNKALLKSNISQTLSFNGNMSLTKKMNITYTSGYDFKGKQITMTQIGITRDLHCWEMNFNWVPNGSLRSWNFTIRVKASVLADLKYERRKDFHDTY